MQWTQPEKSVGAINCWMKARVDTSEIMEKRLRLTDLMPNLTFFLNAILSWNAHPSRKSEAGVGLLSCNRIKRWPTVCSTAAWHSQLWATAVHLIKTKPSCRRSLGVLCQIRGWVNFRKLSLSGTFQTHIEYALRSTFSRLGLFWAF